MGKALKDIEIDDDAFKHIEAIIHSMTPYERRNPDTLDASRRRRVAAGAVRNVNDVNKLIKQFDETRKMMKAMTSKSRMANLATSLKGARRR